MTLPREHCKNPWNGECSSQDIEVYILYKGRRTPLCSKCWTKIAQRDFEW